MTTGDVVEYVVVTDRAAEDVTDLYPLDGPAVGQSTVSIPLLLAPRDGVAGAKVQHLSSPTSDAPMGGRWILWAGALTAPTGDLVISDWSMQPQATIRLCPGPFSLTVAQRESGDLELEFVELADESES